MALRHPGEYLLRFGVFFCIFWGSSHTEPQQVLGSYRVINMTVITTIVPKLNCWQSSILTYHPEKKTNIGGPPKRKGKL